MTTMSSPATADAGATIEVRAQSGLTAAIAGTLERSTTVVDGVAVFAGLSEGTYRVVLTDESTPVPDRAGVGIRGALQIFNGGTYELHAGDHAVVSCDASTCSGVLGR
jgi:hypothetical protein